MKMTIALVRTDEGFTVSVPALPGCFSEGSTEEEALANIRDAIREYMAVYDDPVQAADLREIEVEA